jgi:hypothetical protein
MRALRNEPALPLTSPQFPIPNPFHVLQLCHIENLIHDGGKGLQTYQIGSVGGCGAEQT